MPASETRRRRGASNPNESDARREPSNGPTATTSDSGGSVVPQTTRSTRTSWEEIKKTAIQSVFRAILMYASIRYFMKVSKDSEKSASNKSANTIMASPSPKIEADTIRKNLWDITTRYELRVFDSLNPVMSLSNAMETKPRYSEQNIVYTLEAPNYRARNVTLRVPVDVSHQNSSWYAHIFLTKEGTWLQDPRTVDARNVLYSVHEIVSWAKGSLSKEGKSLLSSKTADNDEKTFPIVENEKDNQVDSNSEDEKITQQWKPTMSITLITDYNSIKVKTLPPSISKRYKYEDSLSGSPAFYPPLFVNEFWLLSDQLRVMNSSVSEATIEMSFSPMSMSKWALQAQFENTFEMQVKMGTANTKEMEKIKRMFLETNPILLGTTMIVSMAHSVLEALAFRNDISHWNSIKSMEGISVRSMMVKIFMELVVFLYLLDNETSWMILLGNAVGISIEVWKLCKAVEFKNFGKRKIMGFIPWFEMVDRDSYSKKTREYDEQAMRYLSYVSYPLVAMYSVYALVYEKHKSWYSWVLGSLVGAVYAFGFIMMFPQIFINYKLKSVAHLPMKAMMYKTLNTIIDDLFSFVIKMPWLHRLACFRDDFVFAIYLYQRWIYPVDRTRVNEFGQKFDENGEQVGPKSDSMPSDETSETSSSTTSTSKEAVHRISDEEVTKSKPIDLKKKE